MLTKRSNSKNYYSEFTLNGRKYIKSTKTADKKLATKIDLEYYKQVVEQLKLVGKSISLREALKFRHDYSKDNTAYQKSVVSVSNWLNDNFDMDLPMTRIDNSFLVSIRQQTRFGKQAVRGQTQPRSHYSNH